jgi:hypothetical protein
MGFNSGLKGLTDEVGLTTKWVIYIFYLRYTWLDWFFWVTCKKEKLRNMLQPTTLSIAPYVIIITYYLRHSWPLNLMQNHWIMYTLTLVQTLISEIHVFPSHFPLIPCRAVVFCLWSLTECPVLRCMTRSLPPSCMTYQCSSLICFYLKNGGSRFLWNVTNHTEPHNVIT